MSEKYYVKVFIATESEGEEYLESQKDAMKEIESLSLMQPENTYAVYQGDDIKIAVIDNKIFLPM